MEKLESQSLDLEKHSIEKIKELFPEVITEGKVDFDKLRLILGDEVDESTEKYQFTWNGKGQTIKLAQKPSTGTLRPAKEESKNWNTTENLYIEGDNLEVLKQLQKTYFGKIKMIYIDPPYNTGGDFVYKDDFKDSIKNYKEQTNQTSRSNADTSGRYHTDWLNMIYSRLLLSKNLLSDNGVIFVSVDDHEKSNLKKIMDEIFGEFNYVSSIIWQRAFSPKNDNKHISNSHDYLLVYSKNLSNLICRGIPRNKDSLNRYTNPDNDNRGPWQSSTMTVSNGTDDYLYEIVTPKGRRLFPPKGRYWVYNRKRYEELLADNRIWFGKNGEGVPRIKTYLSEVNQRVNPMSIWLANEVDHSQGATQKLKKLFDGNKYFSYPKPVDLIKKCLDLYTSDGDYVLDFFSGSATTAHAVLKLNFEDGGERKFIMVQLPEKTDEKSDAFIDGYYNICEIGKERIRRAGEQIKQEMEKEGQDSSNLDIGFKVFKLDDTNIKEWDSSQEVTETTLFDQKEVFKEGRTEEDVLCEILLKYGVFDMPRSETLVNNKVAYDVGQGDMVVALFDDITAEDVKAIGELKPRVVIFKDSGFKDDNVKLNALHNLQRQGVEDVKSI